MGIFMVSGSRATLEVLAVSGFDFVLFDAQHFMLNNETIEQLITAAEAAGVTPFIRVQEHYKFNDTFIAASQNDLLIGILKNLRHQIVWFRFHNFFLTGYKEYVLKVHSEMLNLFKEKNADRLETLTKEHVFFTFSNFLKYLENEKKKD